MLGNDSIPGPIDASLTDGGSSTPDGGTLCQPLAIDNAQSQSSDDEGDISWEHTVGTGDNRLLIVAISTRSSMGSGSVASVTYGGIDLANARSDQNGNALRTELWSLSNPTPGDALIEVKSTNVSYIVAGSVSFIGVDPENPLDQPKGSLGSISAPSITLSSAPGNIVLDTLAVTRGGGTRPAAGPDQTEQWQDTIGNSLVGLSGAGSTANGASSVTMSWTINILSSWVMSAVSIRPCQQGENGSPAN